MADSSEFGWDTVSAFQSGGHPDGEDEARCILRAEATVRSQRKIKSDEAASKSKGRGAGRGRGKKVQNNQNVAAEPTPGQVPMQQQYYSPYPPQFNPYYQPQKPPVKCYRCYGFGHTSKTCPNPLPSFNYAQQEAPAAK